MHLSDGEADFPGSIAAPRRSRGERSAGGFVARREPVDRRDATGDCRIDGLDPSHDFGALPTRDNGGCVQGRGGGNWLTGLGLTVGRRDPGIEQRKRGQRFRI